VTGQEATLNILVPIVQELKRRGDEVDMLANQPYYQQQQLPEIQDKDLKHIKVYLRDLDSRFDEYDIMI